MGVWRNGVKARLRGGRDWENVTRPERHEARTTENPLILRVWDKGSTARARQAEQV